MSLVFAEFDANAALLAGLLRLVGPTAINRMRRIFGRGPASSEVALGERATGAGLEVGLEAGGGSGVCKLDRQEQRPRSVIPCDARRTGVVPMKALGDVAGEADVVALGMDVAAENIDEAA
jgi:hypothetical protein